MRDHHPGGPGRGRGRRYGRRAIAGLFGLNVVVVCVAFASLAALAGLLGAATALIAGRDAAACPATEAVPAPAAVARAGIPVNYLRLYREAGEQYEVPWAVLAALGKVETNHGRSTLPGVRSGVNNNGCCAGPMQFNQRDGSPTTWESYRVDGNGDGEYDIHDPRDAIPSAGNYVRALMRNAHGKVRQAIFGYNHLWSYVEEVLGWAAVYTGARALELASPLAILDTGTAEGAGVGLGCAAAAGLDAAAGIADLQSAVPLTAPRAYKLLPQWAMAGSRAPQPVDARLYNNMVWLLRRYHLVVTGAREEGHKTHGDGTALDLIPADGRTQAIWDASAGQAARDVGWTPSCASSGSRGPCPLIPALHWVGYDGFPGHGSPRTCSRKCYAHLHISWESPCYGTGTPSPPCTSVTAFRSPIAFETPA